jgi:hypothetical protein
VRESRGATKSSSIGSSDETIVAEVDGAILRDHLLERTGDCIAYHVDSTTSADYYIVDVRENHDDPKCGGDPNTAPRLFSVRVSKTTGDISTDRGSPYTGEFHPIPK